MCDGGLACNRRCRIWARGRSKSGAGHKEPSLPRRGVCGGQEASARGRQRSGDVSTGEMSIMAMAGARALLEVSTRRGEQAE